MRKTYPFAATVVTALLAFPAAAILARPDRDDEEYRELATRYPSAVSLEAANGSGVFIAPRWILTSANRAVALQDRNPAAKLRIQGREIEIQEVHIHPDWRPGGEADLALVFLRQEAAGVEPSPFYRDSDEAGQAARIVGYGSGGRIGGFGDQGPVSAAGPSAGTARLARAAINTVDRVTTRTLALRLKGPEEASDLQGALASGDSGAPAFFEVGGRIFVGAIASKTESAGREVLSGRVGDWETYTRVSAFAGWIDDVMSKVAVEEAARATAKPRN